MRTRMVTMALILVAVGSLAVGYCQGLPDMRIRKKLIECGWDTPDTAMLRQHLAAVEQAPYDGIRIKATGKTVEGELARLTFAFGPEEWDRESFQQALDDLKACNWQRMTDNFLATGANPGSVDWFDDEGWAQITEHMRIAAWIAREGGLRGIIFDPESYSEYHQWMYTEQPGRDQHSFEEYYDKARERGREVMGAICEEYPQITVFTFFANIVNATAAKRADPRTVLKGLSYGLYTPFIDGWLDALPPTATLIDGCERAYHFNDVDDFLNAAQFIRSDAQTLVSPENRAKYRAQVQVGFGIYLDAHANPPGSKYYIDPGDQTPTQRLARNITSALRVCDEYVWTWGEKWHWWPCKRWPENDKPWELALPGITDALNWARDPQGYGLRRVAEMERAGTLVELARNGDFGSETAATPDGGQDDWKQEGAPAGWSTWQAGASEGIFAWDREVGAIAPGSARMTGVSDGCFIQVYDVQPGERYFVRAVARQQGRGWPQIRVRWQTPEGQWTLQELDPILTPEPSHDEWKTIAGVVTVPEGVGKLVILLGVKSQASEEDIVWFDDVSLVKLQ